MGFLPLITSIVLAPFTWNLQYDVSGLSSRSEQNFGPFTTPQYTLGQALPGSPQIGLFEAVLQDKGDENLPINWADDLDELYFLYREENAGEGSGASGFTVNFSGPWTAVVTVRTDMHEQRWNQVGSGTAIRRGDWESQERVRVSPVED